MPPTFKADERPTSRAVSTQSVLALVDNAGEPIADNVPLNETGTPHAVSRSLPVPGRGARASLRERLFTQQVERRQRQASQASVSSGEGTAAPETSIAGSPVAIAHSYVEYATTFGPYGEMSRSAQVASSLPERSDLRLEPSRQTAALGARGGRSPSHDSRTSVPSLSSSPCAGPATGGRDSDSASSSSIRSSSDNDRIGHVSPDGYGQVRTASSLRESEGIGRRHSASFGSLVELSGEARVSETSLALRLVAPPATAFERQAAPLDEYSETSLHITMDETPAPSALAKSMTNKPRIVFMGRTQSGKTSLHSVVFHQTSAHETLFLENTPRIVAHDVTYSPWMCCQLVDTPGTDSIFWQHAYQTDGEIEQAAATAQYPGEPVHRSTGRQATEEMSPGISFGGNDEISGDALHSRIRASSSEGSETVPCRDGVLSARDGIDTGFGDTPKTLDGGSAYSASSSEVDPMSVAKTSYCRYRAVLEHADAVVYVIDSSTDLFEPVVTELSQILNCLRNLHETRGRHGPPPLVWLCLHKWDQAVNRLGPCDPEQQDAEALATCWSRIFASVESQREAFGTTGSRATVPHGMEGVSWYPRLEIRRTSIFDDSCMQSMTSLLRKLLPQLAVLNQQLELFVRESGVSEAFLFDVFTRLCLAATSNAAPVPRYCALAAEWAFVAREWSIALYPSALAGNGPTTAPNEGIKSTDAERENLDDLFRDQATMQLTSGDSLTVFGLSPVLVLVYVGSESSVDANRKILSPPWSQVSLRTALTLLHRRMHELETK